MSFGDVDVLVHGVLGDAVGEVLLVGARSGLPSDVKDDDDMSLGDVALSMNVHCLPVFPLISSRCRH